MQDLSPFWDIINIMLNIFVGAPLLLYRRPLIRLFNK